jgi:sucrose-6F-phosphate phosphohydrolase
MSAHQSKRNWQELKLEYLSEFVFTNGESQWDNPSPGQNYKNPGYAHLAIYRGTLLQIEESEPILLLSDLDNTLVGSHPDTRSSQKRFNEYWISKHYFGCSKLVYNTGRSLEEYLELEVQGNKMLDPDMLITAVGSDAYTLNHRTGLFECHIDFHQIYDGEFWDSNIIAELIQERFTWMQIPQKQFIYPFKVWVTARAADVALYKKELKDFLKNTEKESRDGKVIHARAIISGFGDWRYIDIVPRIGGKRVGVIYAQKFFKFTSERTVVAGDSGNDIEMFRDPRHFGIVVNNADEEMTKWFEKKKRINKIKSNEMWGDGVVEGIEKIFYSKD